MQRLLFCTSSLAWGGAERQTLMLMNRLAEHGHACETVYIKNDASQLRRVAQPMHGAVRCLAARYYLDRQALAAYGTAVERFAPTVIVAANPYALLYSAIARHLARHPVPLVHTFHSTSVQSWKETLQMLAYRPLFWMAACTVFVCQRQRRYWQLRGALSRRNEVIYNGVDLREFYDHAASQRPARLRSLLGLHESDYVIGLTAAMRPEKNHVQLVDAVARLHQRGIPARALLIGDGEMRETIVAHARRLGVANDVIVTGFQSDVRPFVLACDTMVLCSLSTEALSLAALEAMALRRPLVLSNIGGAAEMVMPGRNGFLFPPGDTNALVDKLALLSDRARARRLGDAGRAAVEAHFSEARMVARYEQLFDSLGRGGAGPLHAVGGHGC